MGPILAEIFDGLKIKYQKCHSLVKNELNVKAQKGHSTLK